METDLIIERIKELDEEQKKCLIQYMEFHFSPDSEDPDTKMLRHTIYKKYAKDIAQLIAIVEVYTHDLPRKITGIIEMIFRMMSVAAVVEDKEQEYKLYNFVYGYEGFLINILHLTLINIFIKEIKGYRKVLKKFKYRAIKLEDDKLFMNEVDNKLKEVESLYKKGKKKFIKIYELGLLQKAFFLCDSRIVDKYFKFEIEIKGYMEEELSELTKAFKTAQYVMDICEEKYPEVIDNGYNSSFLRRFFDFLPTIISFLLAVGGAIIIFNRVIGARVC